MTLSRYVVNAAGIRSIPIHRLSILALHDGTPGEMQGAIHGIALDWNQPALDIRRQPRLHRRCEPAKQRDAGSVAATTPPRVSKDGPAPLIASATLLQGRDTVTIEHNGRLYQLRQTRQGKLILTK